MWLKYIVLRLMCLPTHSFFFFSVVQRFNEKEANRPK